MRDYDAARADRRSAACRRTPRSRSCTRISATCTIAPRATTRRWRRTCARRRSNPELGADVYLKLGNIRLRRQEREEAVRCWERALELDPRQRHRPHQPRIGAPGVLMIGARASPATSSSSRARSRVERGFGCASYKEKCLRRRIAVRMRARGVHTYGDYARHARRRRRPSTTGCSTR